MLTVEENEQLTRVGPGTPMGNLMRRYWQPLAAVSEMQDRWTKRVKLLGEDLVLFKDRQGRFGLIAEFCPHRRASLAYGIPQEDGIRCPYHGWKFDRAGSCIEQPNEPEGSSFKDKIKTAGYPVQELGGLLWAYLGPLPAPLLPRYDGFVAKGAIRMVGSAVVNCNWLQIMENSVDPVHTEWLHGKLYEFVEEKNGVKVAISKHHVKIGFDEFEHGIIKRRLLEGQSEDVSDWKDGHPVVFPNILAVGSGGGLWTQYVFQLRVPMDDTHTMHLWYHAYIPPEGAVVPQKLLDEIAYYDVPIKDANGEYMLNFIHVQDIMAWETQGPIADRSRESIAWSDQGVTMYRKMLRREMKKAAEGQDPMNIIRDPAKNDVIELPLEKFKEHFADGFESLLRRHMASFSPIAEDIIKVFAQKPKEQRETVGV
ncbi:MAG TPA: Rieske 2Fe-2S domain-containing protein [Candidatus Acidoferrales bacterium]|nr:Rieske 2Fe-2S domain-containing protein [Candidatus Acidoferrales bacterium]